MGGRNYPRLSIEVFGAQLLSSFDLDPVYCALYTLQSYAVWAQPKVSRFLIAYWCLYHCGAAAWLADKEGNDFWQWLRAAAENVDPAPTGGRWPRGHERRHWRGKQALDSWNDLAFRWPKDPELMVDYIRSAGHDFRAVSEQVQTLRGFGPWISFKICDMLDRCLGHSVDFTEAAVFMFKDPKEAALMLWRERMAPPGMNAKPRDELAAIHGVVDYLRDAFQMFTAPPLDDRPIGLQEIETILCKWKSHQRGHYPLNNDLVEIHDGLGQWVATSPSVREFTMAMPAVLS